MSKNLRKGAAWFQKEIDELKSKSEQLRQTADQCIQEANEIDERIFMYQEMIEKLGVTEVKENEV